MYLFSKQASRLGVYTCAGAELSTCSTVCQWSLTTSWTWADTCVFLDVDSACSCRVCIRNAGMLLCEPYSVIIPRGHDPGLALFSSWDGCIMDFVIVDNTVETWDCYYMGL